MSEAGPDLTLVEEFLNTLDERTFRRHGDHLSPGDELSSVAALSVWLRAHTDPDAPNLDDSDLDGSDLDDSDLDDSDLDAAVALRAALRQALASGGDEDAAQALSRFPLRLVPTSSGRLRLAADSGVRGLDVIVETVAASVAGGGWSRLKLCSAPDCRWAFYDTSRNGSGRWCSMNACGNRNKTRAYRRRQAE